MTLTELVLDDAGLPSARTVPTAEILRLLPWRSETFRGALRRVRRFAPARAPLLVRGESGVGKSGFAELAHRTGRRPDEPFTVVNCAAIPDALVESELFGHVRGAFTGAAADRAGLLRAARGGTVLLDEIDKASSAMQATLLHVLDRREARPVGGHEPRPVRARLVFASNRDLAELAARDGFLPDLVHRIAGLEVVIPPVRERREDLDLLLALGLREVRLAEGASVSLGRPARDLLAAGDWPGNVRQLHAVLRAAALLAGDGAALGPLDLEPVLPRTLAARLRRAAEPGGLAARVRALERDEILLALRLEGGRQAAAAARLGLTRRGLHKKLHRLGLSEKLVAEGLVRPRRGAGADRNAQTSPGNPR